MLDSSICLFAPSNLVNLVNVGPASRAAERYIRLLLEGKMRRGKEIAPVLDPFETSSIFTPSTSYRIAALGF